MITAVSSAVDPYIFGELSPGERGYSEPIRNVGYVNSAGRVPVSPRLVESERTGVFVLVGQSKICNTSEGLYTPVSTKVENFNFYNGSIWRAVDPLLGCAAAEANFMTRVGDKLISAGTFDRVILVPVAVGSVPVESWVSGSVLSQRILVACRRLSALNIDVTGFIWDQGEGNMVDPWPTESDYRAKLESVISVPRTEGYNAPWFINKVSTAPGVIPDTGQGAGMRAAQTNIVNGTDIFAGADTDSLGVTYRQSGGVHWNPTGNDAVATLMFNAIAAAL